jgi:uncharacterized protein YcgI (DUF1989 family)
MNEVAEIDGRRAKRIPARHGIASQMKVGQMVTVLNTYGKQVIDAWAFNATDMDEIMSMEHSRAAMLKLAPRVGDTLVTNRRRAILTLVADTTPGVHDTLIAACDTYRYRDLGAPRDHANCTNNLHAALAAIGRRASEVPSPLNLFMNVPVEADGTLQFRPPTSEAGQYVRFRAEMDLVIVFSACPQDMLPVNDLKPTDAHFLIQ